MEDFEDPKENPLPLPLRVVAYVTILFGIGSVIDVAVDLFHGKLSFNFGVLQIPAGFGLLRLSRGWRTFALVCLWFGFIVAGIMIFMLASGSPLKITSPLPRPLLGYGREVALTYCVVWVSTMIWEYRVLTNPRIKRLFGL